MGGGGITKNHGSSGSVPSKSGAAVLILVMMGSTSATRFWGVSDEGGPCCGNALLVIWDNGKENGNYRGSRDHIGVI